MKTCFLIDHRDTGDEIYPALDAAIEAAIVEHGIQEFIVGHYGRFDRMAARALVTAKSKHREIKLTLLFPYLTHFPLPEGFDGSVYPEGLETVPKRFAILQANYKIIDRCDLVIACLRYSHGGAYKCISHAQSKNKCILALPISK